MVGSSYNACPYVCAQGARGNDGLPGPAGPPVSALPLKDVT